MFLNSLLKLAVCSVNFVYTCHFLPIEKAGRFKHLLQIAISEPPRVRAILGAIGQELGYSEKQLINLRKSLNPLSKFDFGRLIALKYASQWQAKERKS